MCGEIPWRRREASRSPWAFDDNAPASWTAELPRDFAARLSADAWRAVPRLDLLCGQRRDFGGTIASKSMPAYLPALVSLSLGRQCLVRTHAGRALWSGSIFPMPTVQRPTVPQRRRGNQDAVAGWWGNLVR